MPMFSWFLGAGYRIRTCDPVITNCVFNASSCFRSLPLVDPIFDNSYSFDIFCFLLLPRASGHILSKC
jgi:hypothetical protein